MQYPLIFFVLLIVCQTTAKTCYPETYTFGLLFDHKADRYQCHGLWVDSCCKNMNPPSYPFFCKNVTFDWNELKPIWANLTDNWYPYGDKVQQKHLIDHEWQKHGSCTNYDILTFFQLSLCIRDKLSSVIPLFCQNIPKECVISLEGKVRDVIQKCNLYFAC